MSNLIGLAILITGAMALNQYTKELVSARVDNLHSQAHMITSVMGDSATGFGSGAELDVGRATDILRRIDLPERWRVRLHDRSGQLLADSAVLDGGISVTELEPLNTVPPVQRKKTLMEAIGEKFSAFTHNLPWRVERRDNLRRNLAGDIKTALNGETVGGERYTDNDDLIVTVTRPVRRVQQVLGTITLESNDLDDIIEGERRALTPFISLAVLAAVLSSIALTMSIVYPLRQLAHAATIVARSNSKQDVIPDFSKRGDEIGDLSVVLRDMTQGLYSRIDDIADFAADVAHEIKNPLTSLRSASDTLRHVKGDEQRTKLIDIIQSDVGRMDRLISDISKASKVDAGLARATAGTINIHDIVGGITEFYTQTRSGDGAEVDYLSGKNDPEPIWIRAFEDPFAQVLRNLIDNALTFSPPDGTVRIRVKTERSDKGKGDVILTVEDDGPGIPPKNLETVFERFYTERPKGARFGSHSGLGLAICRQIVTAHNGTIRAENRTVPGGDKIAGARFIVTLPEVRPAKIHSE